MKLKRSLNWKTDNVCLLLVIITGAVLRFYKLGAQSFWLDEASSIILAKSNSYDVSHPPLSFVILRVFIETLGTNEFTARLPSCLFGIATIPLVYLFGKQIFSEKEGLVASFIISLSPWYIRWSQEARMYTELTVFTIFALYFFYHATQKETATFYILAAIFTTLAFYTHYSGILIIGMIVFWLISEQFFENRSGNTDYKHLAIFFGLFFLLCLPLFFINIPQAIDFKLGGEEIRWGAPSVTYFVFHLVSDKYGPIFSIFTILGAVLLVLRRKTAGILLILYALIPFLTFSLLIFRMNVDFHYVLFTLPAYALLSSYLLIEILKKIMKSEEEKEIYVNVLKSIQINKILAIGFLVGILFGMHNLPSLYYYYSDGIHPNWRTACLFVKSNMDPDDLIVSTVTETVEYYLGRVDYKLSEVNFEEIKNSQSQMWLLIDDWRIRIIDPDYDIRNWLDSHCEMVKEVKLISVYLFTP